MWVHIVLREGKVDQLPIHCGFQHSEVPSLQRPYYVLSFSNLRCWLFPKVKIESIWICKQKIQPLCRTLCAALVHCLCENCPQSSTQLALELQWGPEGGVERQQCCLHSTPVWERKGSFLLQHELVICFNKINTYIRTTWEYQLFLLSHFWVRKSSSCYFLLFGKRQNCPLYEVLCYPLDSEIFSALFGIQKMTDCQGCPVCWYSLQRTAQCCLGLPWAETTGP